MSGSVINQPVRLNSGSGVVRREPDVIELGGLDGDWVKSGEG